MSDADAAVVPSSAPIPSAQSSTPPATTGASGVPATGPSSGQGAAPTTPAPTDATPPPPAAAETEPTAGPASAPAPVPGPSSAPAGAASDGSAPPAPASDDASPPPPPEPATALDLIVVDSAGRAISGLPLRVMRYGDAGKVLVVEASTNGKGALPSITALPVGTRFEVQIKNDLGVYKMAAIGTIQSQQMTGNLMLPHQRFEFATYSHDAAPGTAEKAKQATASKHTQRPDGKVDVSRNGPAAPTVTLNHTEQGNPKAIVSAGSQNMLGQNRMSASNPNLGLSAPDKVKALIDFGMEQLTWVHPDGLTSATIIEQMKRSTYRHDDRPKALGSAKSVHRCAKYVKIALWKAGYIPSDGDFAPGVSPAAKLGPGLLSAGFADVTASLPDARWAAPGDVIVYRKNGAPDADGHIDIRTYDGYLSDFWDSYLPVSGFTVIGVYRKYFDPLPDKRLRAFLKVIRSREAETLFKSQGDASAYRALPMSSFPKGTPPQMFDSFKEHPYANEARRYPSGAYGITVDSWKSSLAKWVSVPEGADRFSPLVQDRIAVALMDLHPGVGYGTASYQTTLTTSLGLVRLGRIEDAARQLSSVKTQWSSLPGGSETRGYTMEKMLSDYQKYLDELG